MLDTDVVRVMFGILTCFVKLDFWHNVLELIGHTRLVAVESC